MRVAIDLSPAVHGRAGMGRYARELAIALRAVEDVALTVFYNRAAEATVPRALADLPRATIPDGDKPWRLRTLAAHALRRAQDDLAPGVDLFHATDNLLPALRATPTVLTVHDLAYHHVPQTLALLNRLYLQLMMPVFLRRATRIIAVSTSTKRDIVRLAAIDPDRIDVVHEGVDPRFQPAAPDAVAAVRRRYELPEEFVLFVGTIEPRKNLTTLLTAVRTLLDRGQPVSLVVAGRRGWRADAFYEQRTALGLEAQVRLPGFVADADLPALYTAAAAFAYPSLHEGFGLPALEAMACGTPVVASNVASLPEVVDDAGLLVDPTDPAALADALARLLADDALAARLRARGRKWAAALTWRRAAEETVAVYRRAVAATGTPSPLSQ